MGSKYIKSNLHNTRGITPKRATSGGDHLRDLYRLGNTAQRNVAAVAIRRRYCADLTVFQRKVVFFSQRAKQTKNTIFEPASSLILAGFPHLRVVGRWPATPKQARYSALIAFT